MKEHPILFNGPMVRAILDGRKTQTRRIVKPTGAHHIFQFRGKDEARGADEPTGEWAWCSSAHVVSDHIYCPYGKPGDRLWVRETWSSDFANHYPFERVWYAADDARRYEIEVRDGVRGIYSPEGGMHVPFRWRPSIHMPRAVSRITLEVTDVRVERLQAISEQDAHSEGVFAGSYEYDNGEGTESARESFQCLWDGIATPSADWAGNPWVWVVEFKRVSEAA